MTWKMSFQEAYEVNKTEKVKDPFGQVWNIGEMCKLKNWSITSVLDRWEIVKEPEVYEITCRFATHHFRDGKIYFPQTFDILSTNEFFEKFVDTHVKMRIEVIY